jgi:DNA-binding SARP family transcriptional activator
MRFRMLGPLLVRTSAGWVPVAAEQQRIVLAALLTEAGRTVSTERLTDAVWGECPPRTAVNTVHAYVMRLRRLLGEGVLLTRGHGYELAVGESDVDAIVFERRATSGRSALDRGQLEAAQTRLTEALALWRGAVFADVPASPSLTARVSQLEQMRLATEEDRVGVLLDLGRHAQAVTELYRLVDQSPLREGR